VTIFSTSRLAAVNHVLFPYLRIFRGRRPPSHFAVYHPVSSPSKKRGGFSLPTPSSSDALVSILVRFPIFRGRSSRSKEVLAEFFPTESLITLGRALRLLED